MAREHLNNVVLAGPLSRFQVYQQSTYGTKVGFLVGQADGPSLKVSSRLKHDWMIKQGQTAQSVMVMKGYMNGWVKDGKYNFNLGARAGGIYFVDGMIDSHCHAEVEGIIQQVSGQWVTLESNYTIPNPKQGPPVRSRLVVCRFNTDQDPRAVGSLAFVIGRLNPKLNDQWYLHLDVTRGWILWGKK